ncbi:MAG: DUF1579 family protein [Phycisphaeraceae bacterium]|nr:DUF1579 family protein [Phycisphaeraceae bacterium]
MPIQFRSDCKTLRPSPTSRTRPGRMRLGLIVGVVITSAAPLGVSTAANAGRATQPEPTPVQPEVIIEDPLAHMRISTPADLLRSMIDSAKPVREHKALEALVGTWSVESTFRPGPDYPPIVSTGTASVRTVIGGRFVESNVRLTFEHVESESLTLFGFDTRHRHYTLHAIDSFGTYAVNAAGPFDAETRTITFAGEVFEPSPDEKLPGTTHPFEMAFDLSVKDRVTQKVRIRMPDLSWFEMMTVVFERR